jgi:GT2 family glycosyltransferase
MISIIIANCNKKDLLKTCIDSIKEQTFTDIEIIVVDNASSDGSIEMLKTRCNDIKLIENKENLLFCKPYNQGIEASNGEFILCLNNDVVLEKDYLKEALYAINTDKKTGLVSGKILRMDKKTIDSTGLFLGRNRKAVERGYGKKDKGQYEKPGYVFGAGGACAFLRRSLLEDIKDKNGYFDETFGMYYEDLDLCWRARKKGWKAYYTPKAAAYHERGGTTVGKSPESRKIFPYLSYDLKKRYIKNRYRCMLKNDSLWGILINLPFILWYEIKLWGYIILSSSRKRGSPLSRGRSLK